MSSTALPESGVFPSSVQVRPLHPAMGRTPSFAILSTFPPTHCGLATFGAALAENLRRVGVKNVGVVRVTEDSEVRGSDPRVIQHWTWGCQQSRLDAARAINSYDYLLLQHEFGIFGGSNGSEILDLLDDVHIPVIVTLHTVPMNPSSEQRRILEDIARRAEVLVTMTVAAKERLLRLYRVHPERVVTIAHGATVPESFALPESHTLTLLTWGLLGPGKGIEWVVDALAMVPELKDRLRYVVAGQTHPKVRLHHGESYREMLKMRAERLGVGEIVTFDDQYRALNSLMGLIQESACVVLPYDSDDQITSGVLVDAVAAGRPVIATAFPHATELLSDGAGIVVPHRDSVSLAHAIRSVVSSQDLLHRMAEATHPLAREHRWSNVAARYVDVAQEISQNSLVLK